MKRVAAYCRISTNTQDTSSQLLTIKEAIQSNGDTLISVYEDIGISGVKSRSDRPALDQMLRDAKAGKFDKVVCFDISRLGRSMANLISTLQDLEQAGVDIQLLKNGISTDSPGGKMLFGIFGALGSWEREIICERVKAGIANEEQKAFGLVDQQTAILKQKQQYLSCALRE